MSPEVLAAVIAACVSFLTLIGSVFAQLYGVRRTSRDTVATLAERASRLDPAALWTSVA